MPLNGIRFRQDNDFYYLTGNDDVNARPRDGRRRRRTRGCSCPQQGARGDPIGRQELARRRATRRKPWGFAGIQPLTELTEFLERRRGRFGQQVLWTRLSERDEVDDSRGDKGTSYARRYNNPLSGQPSEDGVPR